MQLCAYLTFNGNCEAASSSTRSASAERSKPLIPHEGTPVAQQVQAEWRSKILHARLIVGERVLMGSDAPADR